MLRRERAVVKHTCESAQTIAYVFSHAIESHSVSVPIQAIYTLTEYAN